MKSQDKQIIGWVEKIDLPEYSMTGVPAKIDTGAYSGALHCEYEQLKEEDGEMWLVFKPLGSKKEVRTQDFKRVYVFNTTSKVREERHKVNTTVVIRDKTYPLMITLSDRSHMTYDVIIGRAFLAGRFIVDPSKTNGRVKVKRK